MSIELLYPLLSEAILRAETLEDLAAPGTRSAYLDVSLLEERVAEVLPASDPEGALARRSAVRAALAAREFARAQQLAERFVAEAECDAALRAELLELSEHEAVADLEVLDDEALWRAARSQLPAGETETLEALNFKQQSEGLTETERQQQEQLLTACDRVMLVRAHAAKLLKERGRDISELHGAR